MRQHGITTAQFELLRAIISATGSVKAVRIGQMLEIEKSTLSRNLQRLMTAGFVTMEPPAGRRGRGLHATEKALHLMPAAAAAYAEAEREIATWLPAETVAHIKDVTGGVAH